MVKIQKLGNVFMVGFSDTTRFNCFEVEELMKHLPEFLNTPGCDVCINFKDITFIDTCGMDFLVTLADKSRENGFSYRLSSVSVEVRELFVKTDLSSRILEYAEVISNEPCQ